MTEKEKRKRKSAKQLKSFRNKMGIHIAWFDSLSKTKQYDLLFMWMRRRASTPNEVKVIKKTYVAYLHRVEKRYPAKLSYFIKEMKMVPMFRTTKMKFRQTVIDLILK